MKSQYEVYIWDVSKNDPVIVERKKFKSFVNAWDYQALMEEKGYECHVHDLEDDHTKKA